MGFASNFDIRILPERAFPFRRQWLVNFVFVGSPRLLIPGGAETLNPGRFSWIPAKNMPE